MKHIVEVKKSTLKLDKHIVKTIVRIGLPSGIQQMVMSFSFVLVQSIINSIQIPFNGVMDGAIFVACNTAVMKVDGFAMMPAQTFNQTSSTFVGQNIGAGKLDRCSKGLRQCLIIAVSVSLIVFAVIQIWGGGLMGMFINDPDPARSEKIIEVGIQMMRIMCYGYIMMAVSMTIGGAMRGAGDTMVQMWITLITNIVIRLPLTYFMVHISKSDEYPNGKPSMVFYSMLIGFGLNTAFTAIYFATGKWKTKAVVKRPVIITEE